MENSFCVVGKFWIYMSLVYVYLFEDILVIGFVKNIRKVFILFLLVIFILFVNFLNRL